VPLLKLRSYKTSVIHALQPRDPASRVHFAVGFYNPYSPDLALCDFFPISKNEIEAQRFESIEEIQAELQDVIKMLMQNDFQQCFQQWEFCWYCCSDAEGDYFKGDGGE
jgi:hypothetical protein